MVTVTSGKSKVGVGEIVGLGEIVGVGVWVEVLVVVGVIVAVGVWVGVLVGVEVWVEVGVGLERIPRIGPRQPLKLPDTITKIRKLSSLFKAMPTVLTSAVPYDLDQMSGGMVVEG